jgi:2-haloacid dehalogenase
MSASPSVIVFDVNETLSDMALLRQRFQDVGAPGGLAATWFAGVLRDGFALAVGGVSRPFAAIAESGLRWHLHGLDLDRGEEEAVAHVMEGFASLTVHHDVPDGVRALRDAGFRLVTLTNGSTSVSERLLESAGLLDHFERLMSVEDAGVWKPARAAYAHALDVCGVEPDRALLVAVHPWDVDGAQRAGLRGAWLNRKGEAYPDHFRAPDLRATSLEELSQQLG